MVRMKTAVLLLVFIWAFFAAPLTVSISFDVERDPPAASDGKTSFRGVEGIPLILDILEKHDVKATFFVTGRVADRYPDILSEIYSHGHEVAVHGAYYHDEPLSGLPSERQEEKILATVKAVWNVTGRTPVGYRAPGHLYDDGTLLALRNLNMLYDSSAVPSIGGWYLYGHPLHTKAHPHIHKTGIVEIPTTPVLFDGNLDSLLAYQGVTVTKVELIWTVLKSKFSRSPMVLYLHPGMMADLENSPKNYRASNKRLEELDRILNFLDKGNVKYVTLEEVALGVKQ